MVIRSKSDIHAKAKKRRVLIDSIFDSLNEQRRRGVAYPLQPKQLKFANTFVKYRLFGGAKGGGKSYAMRSEIVRQALSCPNVRGLVLRRTFPEVNENTLLPILSELRLAKIEYKYNGSQRKITFPNGSTIKFSYCRNKQDVDKYQGIEFDFICVEELTHWREPEFKVLKTCLRTSRVGITPNFFASTNPGGIGHDWVRRIWVNRKFKKGENPKDYAFIPANVYDNFILMNAQPDYMQSLEDLPEAQRAAFLHGDWDVFEGQYFPEFRRDMHVVEPYYPIEGVKKRIIAFDYGYSAPSAVLWMVVDNQNKIIIYRELYVTKKTYRQLAILIAAMTRQDELKEISTIIGDPAVVNKQSESSGVTLRDEFEKIIKGIRVCGGTNSRIPGWMRIRQHLQESYNPSTNQAESLLTITSNCSNLIRTLPELIYDTKNVEDCDTTKEDHAPDGLRYGLMELSSDNPGFADIKEINNSFVKNKADNKKINSPLKKKKRRKENLLNTNF